MIPLGGRPAAPTASWAGPVIVTCLALCLPFAGFAQEAPEENPFAGSPDATEASAEAKPDRRSWTVREGNFALSFEFNPGIPDPDNVVEITVFISEVPNRPHPRFGNRIPVRKARVTIGVRDPSGKVTGRYLAHSPPLAADRYAVHVTPQKKGLHTLTLKGTTEDGRPLAAEVTMPVAVWPLPDALKGSGAEAGRGLTRRRPIIKK